MTRQEFARWFQALTDDRQAQAAELCFEVMVTIDGATLDGLRDAIRRALEDCWAARLRDPLEHALEMLKSEATVLGGVRA